MSCLWITRGREGVVPVNTPTMPREAKTGLQQAPHVGPGVNRMLEMAFLPMFSLGLSAGK